MPSTPWPRPLFTPGGGVATIGFVVYAPTLLRWDFTLLAEGSPVASLPASLAVHLFRREDAPEFAEWADGLLEGADPALAGSTCWYEIAGETPSTPDLAALQAAWALVRVLCRAGATAVWDSLAMTWTSAADVLAADPAHPALAASWGVYGGQLDGEPIGMIHTLGLAKFGRPDLLAFASPDGLGPVRELVKGIALDLIEGAVLASGDVVEKAGVRLRAEGYAPGFNGPEVPVPFFAQPLVLVPVG